MPWIPKILLPAVLLSVSLPAHGGSGLKRFQIAFPNIGSARFADLDGDGRADLVFLQGNRLVIFLQDARRGFSSRPQIEYRLEDKPYVLWPRKVASAPGASVLVLTREGLDALTFPSGSAIPKTQMLAAEKIFWPASRKRRQSSFPWRSRPPRVRPRCWSRQKYRWTFFERRKTGGGDASRSSMS